MWSSALLIGTGNSTDLQNCNHLLLIILTLVQHVLLRLLSSVNSDISSSNKALQFDANQIGRTKMSHSLSHFHNTTWQKYLDSIPGVPPLMYHCCTVIPLTCLSLLVVLSTNTVKLIACTECEIASHSALLDFIL